MGMCLTPGNMRNKPETGGLESILLGCWYPPPQQADRV